MLRAQRLATVAALGVSLAAMSSAAVADEPVTVAILTFGNTSQDKKLAGLEHALQDWLTTDLSKVRQVRIVERSRLTDLLGEMNLAKTGVVDPSTAAKLGKALGAKAVLLGSFFAGDGKMRLDARLVHTQTAGLVFAEEMSGSTADFMDLEKKLAGKIINAFKIELSRIEELDMRGVPTRSIDAAAAYGRAMASADAGNLKEARLDAEQALKSDPKLESARKLLTDVQELLAVLDDEELRRDVALVARFETGLPDWPCQTQDYKGYGCPKFEPARYAELYRQGKHHQAMCYWFTRMLPYGAFASPGNVAPDAFRCLFELAAGVEHSDKAPVGTAYMSLGGFDAMAYCCDVFSSDPWMIPTERVQIEDVVSDSWRDTYGQRFRADWVRRYGFVLVYGYVNSWSRGDWSGCASVASRGLKLYGGLPATSDVGYDFGGRFKGALRELEQLLASREELEVGASQAREKRLLWRQIDDGGALATCMMHMQQERWLREPAPLPAAKSSPRGWLGVELADVRDNEGKYVSVLSIADGSPAAEAGVRCFDRLEKLGDAPVTELKELDALMRKHAPGEAVVLALTRESGGTKRHLDVKVKLRADPFDLVLARGGEELLRGCAEMLAAQSPSYLPRQSSKELDQAAREQVNVALDFARGAGFVGPEDGSKGKGEFHIAGCPLSVPRSWSIQMAGGKRTKSTLTRYDGPEQALADGHVPCTYCSPARWLMRNRDGASPLGTALAGVSQSIKTGPQTDDCFRATCLLMAISINCDKNARPAVIQLLETACSHKDNLVRKLTTPTVRALASMGNPEDVPRLAKLLSDCPFWDVRCYAAAALGAIGGEEGLCALNAVVAKEPYYFVRHWIQAARLRIMADRAKDEARPSQAG